MPSATQRETALHRVNDEEPSSARQAGAEIEALLRVGSYRVLAWLSMQPHDKDTPMLTHSNTRTA